MGGYYYDFSELVSEMEQLNGTASEIYSEQSDLLTEIKELREELKERNEIQKTTLGFIGCLLLIAVVVGVLFK